MASVETDHVSLLNICRPEKRKVKESRPATKPMSTNSGEKTTLLLSPSMGNSTQFPGRMALHEISGSKVSRAGEKDVNDTKNKNARPCLEGHAMAPFDSEDSWYLGQVYLSDNAHYVLDTSDDDELMLWGDEAVPYENWSYYVSARTHRNRRRAILKPERSQHPQTKRQGPDTKRQGH